MIYIDVCHSSAMVALTMQVGSRMPLASSAMGRAFLATASEQERNDILSRWQELDDAARTSLRQGVEKGIEDYRKFGCATSIGEWQKDVNGIAVGVHAGAGTPAMAINCGGPSASLSKEFLLREVKPRLLALAARLSQG
jgi:DNA-binding IclR family transcriptional regulator